MMKEKKTSTLDLKVHMQQKQHSMEMHLMLLPYQAIYRRYQALSSSQYITSSAYKVKCVFIFLLHPCSPGHMPVDPLGPTFRKTLSEVSASKWLIG